MARIKVRISNDDLDELNGLLPWRAGTDLGDGRIIGVVGGSHRAQADGKPAPMSATTPAKRDRIEPIPDKRIVRIEQHLGLAGKSVLEVGCFEGIHTAALCGFGAEVTAVDLRPINVVKTAVRLAAYGYYARVLVADCEDEETDLGKYDFVFHCGVLYHLEDPVRHLARLLEQCDAIYLDTHVAEPHQVDDELASGGRIYRGMRYREGGWSDPFSGRAATAFWLTQADLIDLLAQHGFVAEVWSERAERNGLRVGLFAARTGGDAHV